MFNKQQLVILNLTGALAYFFAAYLGGLFALPPSGSSPIWPAAGVALTFLLLFGKPALPGLFLGALAAQTYSFFDASSSTTQLSSILIGVGISIGSCLQAFIGACLIKKFVGLRDPLVKDDQILRFLTLGGPVSCMVTASFSTVIFAYAHTMNGKSLLSNWLTWWVGDVMGVLIFTPLLLLFTGQPRQPWQSRRNYVLYPLLMLLILVVILFNYGKQEEQNRMLTAFNRQTSLLETAFTHQFTSYTEATEELKSFFDNANLVGHEEFSNFSDSILRQHRSLKLLEWIPRVLAAERNQFEKITYAPLTIQEIDAQQQRHYAKERPVYFPITFVQPLMGNEPLVGMDIALDPLVMPTLNQAIDSSFTAATPAILLKHGFAKKHSIIIYSPVYAKAKPLITVEQRRAALRGLVASVLPIEEAVTDIINISELQLFVKIEEDSQVLFNNMPEAIRHKGIMPSLSRRCTIQLANRQLQLTLLPTERFIQTHQSWGRWWILFGGLLFTSLSGMSLLMLTGRTLRTEELITIRTQALSKEVTEREERSRVLHALANSMPLAEVLALIVSIMEDSEEPLFCSILLVDADGKHLKHGASGRLPRFYSEAVDGVAIGDGVGSCGTAAFLGKRIIIEDIGSHPYWAAFTCLTIQAGLKACWSEPIFSADGQQVLGTFAVYYPTIKAPSPITIQRIEEFTQLASLAIEKNKAEEKIRYLAFYDTLTNLPNRRLLLDRLKQELLLTERHQLGGALLFLDLDHFKTLNDSLGHHIGDELLIQVAQRLIGCVRDEDTVARLGGDEFVVLLKALPGNNTLEKVSNYAALVAKRIQSALYIPYSLQGYEHCVTSSIGITLFNYANNRIEQLFKQADTAMYTAKAKGRNAFSFYDAHMEQLAYNRLEMEQELQIALETGQFLLHYQPQYDIKRRIVGAEALLRWQHPRKGLIHSADFMAACEESGLILAVGEWALKTACHYLSTCHSPPLDYLAVNISLRQFQHPSFVQQVADVLRQYPILPSSLMLEFTEKVVINDIRVSTEKLQALQALGVRIAIDNFGTGYSSLVHLKQLPINQLKIDRSFICNMKNDLNNAIIIETMIMMANQLGLHVIAEGVENSEQLEFLHTKRCHIYQGYHFGKPLTANEFSLLLTRNAQSRTLRLIKNG
jgi:diguanylate cyclase (GGDEF)-like protein